MELRICGIHLLLYMQMKLLFGLLFKVNISKCCITFYIKEMSDSSCLLFVNNKNRESPNWSRIIHDKRLLLTEDICLHSYVFLPEHYIDNLHFLSTLCDRSTVSVTSHHCFTGMICGRKFEYYFRTIYFIFILLQCGSILLQLF